jgi:DNA-directed RNA polymerase subunit RPC12/RpoP
MWIWPGGRRTGFLKMLDAHIHSYNCGQCGRAVYPRITRTQRNESLVVRTEIECRICGEFDASEYSILLGSIPVAAIESGEGQPSQAEWH